MIFKYGLIYLSVKGKEICHSLVEAYNYEKCLHVVNGLLAMWKIRKSYFKCVEVKKRIMIFISAPFCMIIICKKMFFVKHAVL